MPHSFSNRMLEYEKRLFLGRFYFRPAARIATTPIDALQGIEQNLNAKWHEIASLIAAMTSPEN